MVQPSSQKVQKGFTLLELLIVLAILAILAVVLIIVLNPSETLKKTRDSQRLSDLSNLKTALGIYVTTDPSPVLGTACLDGTTSTAMVYYSAPTAVTTLAANVVDPGTDTSATFLVGDWANNVTTGGSAVDGTGWIPVNLASITGGSPIASLPLDPTNTVSAVPVDTDLTYRYVCAGTGDTGKPSSVFEIDARLESDAFVTADPKMTTDGGDNAELYEVGTSLKLLGSGTNF